MRRATQLEGTTTMTDSEDTRRYKVRTEVVWVEEVVATTSFEAEMKAKSVREHQCMSSDSVTSEVLEVCSVDKDTD